MKRTTLMLGLAAATGAGGAFEAALAQDMRTEAGATIQEIVVTARRRAEALQEVPVSAVAIDRTAIEALALDSPREIIAQIPSVRMTTSVGSEVSDDITIRGVGVARIDGSAAATGVYRNGVFIGNGSFFGKAFTRFDMFDIDQLEVFRGPQGALWGRNAAGGALNLVSAAPKFEHEGSIKARYEVEQDAPAVELMANVPLGERTAVRLGGVWDDRAGGQIKVDDPASPLDGENIDQSYFSGARLSIRNQPTEALDLRLSVETQRQESMSYAYVMHRPSRGDPDRFTRRCTPLANGLNCSFNEPDGRFHVDTDNIFGNLTWTTGLGDLALSLVYTDREGWSTDDFDVFTYPGLLTSRDNAFPREGTFERWGAEALFISGGGGRLHWLAGADFQHSEDFYTTTSTQRVFNPNATPATETSSTTSALRELDSYSAFASLDFDITERLTASAEVRVTRNELANDASSVATVQNFNTGATVGSAFSNTKPIEETKWTPGATLSYELAPGHRIYGRIATGFRPAGFEPRRAAGAFLPPYEAEDLRSHEIGYKGASGPFAFDLDVYYAVHRDVQLTSIFVNDVGQPVSRIGNAGDAWSAGIEGSIRGRFAVGSGRLDLIVSASHNDGEVDLTGNRLPQTRDYQANLTVLYAGVLSSRSDLSWFANASLQAEGGGYYDPENMIELADFEQVNASIGLSKDRWQLQLFARNLFNEIYATQTLLLFGAPTFTYNQPRTYGLELSMKW